MTISSIRPSFAGKVALIAGASRGIGEVTARAFADAGAAVVLAARDGRALESVTESIRTGPGRAGSASTRSALLADPDYGERAAGGA